MTFTKKLEHEHVPEESTQPTRVYVQGVPQKRIIKIRKCKLDGCDYEEAYDLVKENENGF